MSDKELINQYRELIINDSNGAYAAAQVLSQLKLDGHKEVFALIDALFNLRDRYRKTNQDTTERLLLDSHVLLAAKIIERAKDAFYHSIERLSNASEESLKKAILHNRSETVTTFGSTWNSRTMRLLAIVLKSSCRSERFERGLATEHQALEWAIRRIIERYSDDDVFIPIALRVLDIVEGKELTYNDFYDVISDYTMTMNDREATLKKLTIDDIPLNSNEEQQNDPTTYSF